jgi:osmotically-inducible protein OsmY
MSVATVTGSDSSASPAQPPTDQQVADAVEDEMRVDPAVQVNDIDLTVSNGIVTLRGDVSNLLSRERAVRLAETVRGVSAVVNLLRVRPYWGRTDREIERDAELALVRDPATDSWEIEVEVENAHATLTGTVDSWQEKQLAATVVKGVRGISGISDEIIVDSHGHRVDAEIQHDIEQALHWDVLVDDGLIVVDVEEGDVHLTGIVGSLAEKRRARYEAWVTGVRSVDASGLEVAGWARDEALREDKYVAKADADIEKAVESALFYDPRVVSTNVRVDSVLGTVTLRGKVEDLRAKRAAMQDARNTVGVVHVNDRLKVRPADGKLVDAEIESNLDEALMRDPFVERFEIGVNVANGTAYLSGRVDSHFEKIRAERVAERTYGVKTVHNSLLVDYDSASYPLVYDPYVYDWYPWDYPWYGFEPRYTHLSDVAIRAEIVNELWWSPFVDSDEVNITVENGVATLSGTVDTWGERHAAERNAYEGGAVWVDNDLGVSVD